MLTQGYIQSIVESENLIVRNLQVTQGYYRLSEGMKRCLSSRNVNWCSFATHASKTAGQALRHELMPRLLRSATIRKAGFENTFLFLNEGIGAKDRPQLGNHDGRLAEALRRLSHLVSDGNIVVFRELAWPFAAFITTFRKDWVYDQGRLLAFLDEHLERGPLEQGGQDYLIEAFTAFYNARFENDAKKKSEHVLHGNLLIGLHEQTRLQPQIEQAMTVPLEMFSRSSKGPGGKKRATDKQSAMTRKLISRAVTQMMMSITLPSRELKLSQNVVAPTGVISYPKDLLQIESPRCLELVRIFESGQDTLSGSGAENWASLRDRMSFVVDFFRSHQQYDRMWEPPFQRDQAQAIEAGYFPAGPL
ncbi:MAG TPA: hypothetical protein VLE70_17415 [Anaerolineae bacterium]|jgi:hypothetical protein|nr:hypothetical protein [Anaerolineae bacterium]